MTITVVKWISQSISNWRAISNRPQTKSSSNIDDNVAMNDDIAIYRRPWVDPDKQDVMDITGKVFKNYNRLKRQYISTNMGPGSDPDTIGSEILYAKYDSYDKKKK